MSLGSTFIAEQDAEAKPVAANAAPEGPEVVSRPALLKTIHAMLLDTGSGPALSELMHFAVAGDGWAGEDYLRDLGAAQAFAFRALPGFYVTSGLCYLSGHASIGPDYNGPEGARLRSEWPEAACHSGWHEDLNAADGEVADVGHQCAAILRCVLQAIAYREDIVLDREVQTDDGDGDAPEG